MLPKFKYTKRYGYHVVLLIFLFSAALLAHFPSFRQLESFGFSPFFIDIANCINNTGAYLHGGVNGHYTPEKMREPLYPYALAITKRISGNYNTVTRLQEIAALIACIVWIFIVLWQFGYISAAGLAVLIFFNPVIRFYPSVLYPFSFNFLFVSLALGCCTALLRRGSTIWAAIAGIMFAFASYERGSLAMLPLFAACGLLLLRNIIARRAIAIMLTVYVCCIGPWILRNLSYGIIGMNGMTGYALGYTYGKLVVDDANNAISGNERDPYGLKQAYLTELRKDGSDTGTVRFIFNNENLGVDYALVNRAIVYYVRHAVIRQPQAAGHIVWLNIRDFCGRLLHFDRPQATAWEFYLANVTRQEPSVLDLILVVLFVSGIVLMYLNGEAILAIMLPTMLYIFLVNIPLIIIDPRYRNGIFDIFAYCLALYALRCFCSRLTAGSWRPATGPPFVNNT